MGECAGVITYISVNPSLPTALDPVVVSALARKGGKRDGADKTPEQRLEVGKFLAEQRRKKHVPAHAA